MDAHVIEVFQECLYGGPLAGLESFRVSRGADMFTVQSNLDSRLALSFSCVTSILGCASCLAYGSEMNFLVALGMTTSGRMARRLEVALTVSTRCSKSSCSSSGSGRNSSEGASGSPKGRLGAGESTVLVVGVELNLSGGWGSGGEGGGGTTKAAKDFSLSWLLSSFLAPPPNSHTSFPLWTHPLLVHAQLVRSS